MRFLDNVSPEELAKLPISRKTAVTTRGRTRRPRRATSEHGERAPRAHSSTRAPSSTGRGERPVLSPETVAELTEALISAAARDRRERARGDRRSCQRVGRRGSVGSAGPRYFGFVTGGSLPAALAADWLTSAWDQNAAMAVMSPAASVIEAEVLRWVRELLFLPEAASGGIVTGCSMANFVALSAARHHTLAKLGWDVETQGLFGAPRVRVIAGAERHASVDMALRYAGLRHGRDGARSGGRERCDAGRRARSGCSRAKPLCLPSCVRKPAT